MFDYSAKVLNVVDGDTIDVEIALGFHVFVRERLRLYGVNTPETHGPKAKTEGVAGAAAAAFTTAWVVKNPVVLLKSYDAKAIGQEKFGRWLCVVYDSQGMSLNDALIDSGNAVKLVY